MKYYNAVKASHRIEFDSEADAIKAGYNKHHNEIIFKVKHIFLTSSLNKRTKDKHI